MIDLDELEKLARSATPGPWRVIPGDSYCAYSHVICGNKTQIFEDHYGHEPGECRKEDCCGFPDDHTDAKYVASVDPNTVLELISEIRKLREVNQVMKEALKYTSKACLCERFVTKGFDYGEEHPNLKSKIGARHIAPVLYAQNALGQAAKIMGDE